MTLKIYNTLTRQKEPFETLEPGKVRMYCCGVTVYDYCHLGHARSYIVWDTVRRYLQWRGYQVRYVQNFTDIDDKILNRARQTDTSMQAVADRYTQTYFEDMDRLNVLKADAYPRATQTLDGIQTLIRELEQKGYAYAAEGDVYYAVRRFADYGKLSGRKLDDLQAGASGRVEVAGGTATAGEKKQDPFDFALWKAAKPGEPAWQSPWGEGRPGWHIECSAMVRQELGESIDIHVGGGDLVFPHHENEIAQSEAVTNHPLARYWMHNGMVNVGGEKMSKSLGNFTTIRDLLDRSSDNPDPPDPMAIRLFVLQAQYRKPLDFTEDAIAAAKNSWATLRKGLLFGHRFGKKLGWGDCDDPSFGDAKAMRIANDSDAVQQFQTAMDDDFNSPVALAVLFESAKELRKVGNVLTHQGEEAVGTDSADLRQQWQTLICLASVLGLEHRPEPDTVIGKGSVQLSEPTVSGTGTAGLSDAEIQDLIEARQAARKAKDFAEADRLRDQLTEQKIVLIDQPGGNTQWRRS